MTLPSVLLIDDEKNFRNRFCTSLEDEVRRDLIQIETAGDAREGLKIIEEYQKKGIPIYVFLDIILPGITGIELISEMNSNQIHPRIAIISAHESPSELERIKNQYDWLNAYYTKPLRKATIKKTVKDFLVVSHIPPNITQDTTQFDYNNFDEETSLLILSETQKIKAIMKKTVANIIDIGGSLYKVKSKLEYGMFKNWVKKELPINYNTANNFMRVFDTFGQRKEEICETGLSISVLYILASRNNPSGFCDEVLSQAKAGNVLSSVEVKQLRKELFKRDQFIRKPESKIQDNSISEENTITIDVTPSSNTKDVAGAENVTTQQNTSTIKAEPQEIIKVVPKQKVWHLGNHILYCGLPDSPEFKELLKPFSISLNICFPPDSNWTKKDYLSPIPTRSTLVYNNLAFDPDEQLETLSRMLELSIELSTTEKDKILFAFFPHPELLLLMDELLCTSIIAEPDPQKCEAIISLWREHKS